MERRKQFIQMALVFVALAGAILSVGYTVRKDRAKAPAKFARTPERLERGRYIVESTAHCFQCLPKGSARRHPMSQMMRRNWPARISSEAVVLLADIRNAALLKLFDPFRRQLPRASTSARELAP